MNEEMAASDWGMPAEAARRVDAACDRFEAAWRAHQRPRIKDHLADAADDIRSVLRRELINLDMNYRRRQGEHPQLEDYPADFGDVGALLPDTARTEPLPPSASPHGHTPGDPDVPDRVGRYSVIEKLGKGGMGAVLRALDPDFGRTLALKVLLAEHQNNPELVHRFLEEARISGRLAHPGIVPVHELGSMPDRRPFFTMKLVQGQTLADLLKQRTTPQDDLPRFLTIFEQVCQTLAYAHAAGVIHRDLKPANVMVGAFGEVQVMDWAWPRCWRRTVLPARRQRPRKSVPSRQPANRRQRGRGPERYWGRSGTWRRSRRAVRLTRLTSAPTCSAWERSCA
jgi:hypothetical protein